MPEITPPLAPGEGTVHLFQPGDVLEGRFRIVREVARGGMGVVYEAEDQKLQRRIALKCAKAHYRARLTPEVKHASEISHPNVCKIYEIHTAATPAGDIDFITMEFLEGETLARRLLRGPIPPAEARALAIQLCAGVAEAHRQGVIHGDLKTGNVILTVGPDGRTRAAITDFGLSRASDTAPARVPKGATSGTPGYMAPELWRGAPSTAASDIFALGVIFYEMIAGHRPHDPAPGSVPQSASTVTLGSRDPGWWEERLRQKPRPAHPQWDRILARCLQTDPARRFQNAGEIETALGPSRTRRWIAAGAAAVVLAAISGIVTWQRATGPQETVRLAIPPFQTDAGTAALANGLRSDAAARIGTIASSPRTRFRFLPLRDGAAGATHVLQATLTASGGRTTIHALLTDNRTRVNLRDWTAEYAAGEMKYAPLALAGIATWGLHLPAAAQPPMRSEALADYREGLAHLRNVNAEVDAARAAMEKAVAADPDSAVAHAGLAEAQWFTYFQTHEQTWLDRALESARQAGLRHPDLAPVHRIAGWLRFNTGRYEQAEAELRRAIEVEPDNDNGHRRLARVFEKNDQLDEALSEYKRAVELGPSNYANYQDLGALYFKRGRFTDSLPYSLKAVELGPQEAGTHFALASDYLNLGRFVEAEKELRVSIGLKETAPSVHSLGLVLMFEGRDKDAVPYFQRALELGPDRYLSWMYLGIVWRRLGNRGEAARANRRGLDLAESAVARDPRSGYTRSFLAYLCSQLGSRERAGSEIAQALQLSPRDADVGDMALWTYEALGRRTDALKLAATLSPEQLAWLNQWPDLADLRRDPQFTQLLKGYSIK